MEVQWHWQWSAQFHKWPHHRIEWDFSIKAASPLCVCACAGVCAGACAGVCACADCLSPCLAWDVQKVQYAGISLDYEVQIFAVLISVARCTLYPSQTPRTMAAVWYKLLKIQQQQQQEDFMKLVLVVRALLERKKRRQHRVVGTQLAAENFDNWHFVGTRSLVGSTCLGTAMYTNSRLSDWAWSQAKVTSFQACCYFGICMCAETGFSALESLYMVRLQCGQFPSALVPVHTYAHMETPILDWPWAICFPHMHLHTHLHMHTHIRRHCLTQISIRCWSGQGWNYSYCMHDFGWMVHVPMDFQKSQTGTVSRENLFCCQCLPQFHWVLLV